MDVSLELGQKLFCVISFGLRKSQIKVFGTAQRDEESGVCDPTCFPARALALQPTIVPSSSV
jgi:hypothetical protein